MATTSYEPRLVGLKPGLSMPSLSRRGPAIGGPRITAVGAAETARSGRLTTSRRATIVLADSAIRESRLAGAVKEPPKWNSKRSAIFSR